MQRLLMKHIKEVNLYETIRSLELAYEYKFDNKELLYIIQNYYNSNSNSKL